jgi:hypothetical protein
MKRGREGRKVGHGSLSKLAPDEYEVAHEVIDKELLIV